MPRRAARPEGGVSGFKLLIGISHCRVTRGGGDTHAAHSHTLTLAAASGSGLKGEAALSCPVLPCPRPAGPARSPAFAHRASGPGSGLGQLKSRSRPRAPGSSETFRRAEQPQAGFAVGGQPGFALVNPNQQLGEAERRPARPGSGERTHLRGSAHRRAVRPCWQVARRAGRCAGVEATDRGALGVRRQRTWPGRGPGALTGRPAGRSRSTSRRASWRVGCAQPDGRNRESLAGGQPSAGTRPTGIVTKRQRLGTQRATAPKGGTGRQAERCWDGERWRSTQTGRLTGRRVSSQSHLADPFPFPAEPDWTAKAPPGLWGEWRSPVVGSCWVGSPVSSPSPPTSSPRGPKNPLQATLGTGALECQLLTCTCPLPVQGPSGLPLAFGAMLWILLTNELTWKAGSPCPGRY